MASTEMSKLVTPFLVEGEDLRSQRLKRKRLTVMLRRKHMCMAKENVDMESHAFHGRFGDVLEFVDIIFLLTLKYFSPLLSWVVI